MARALPLLPVLALLCACGSASRGPNVVLVVIDTFRADHVSSMGYGRATTPVLDSLAMSGGCWTDFRAQSSWTLPAFATILTGLTPREHMAGRRDGIFYGLDPALPTMQRMFGDAGYNTAAFLNVIFLNEDFGFHVGFDTFDCAGVSDRSSQRRAGETVDLFLAWLDRTAGEGSFFAVVHFYDPHMPYDPPAPYSEMFTDPGYAGPCDSAWGTVPQLLAVNEGIDTLPADGLDNLTALYDGEIAYSDAQLGRLLAGLRERGLAGCTVVAVTGDHGEEFLEHGSIEHGVSLYEEAVRVPLVISGPGVLVGASADAASQVDILPTLAALCGLEPPPGPAGIDLMSAGGAPVDRRVFASGVLWRDADLASCTSSGRKTIYDTGSGGSETFDLASDPGEVSPTGTDSLLLSEALTYWATPAAGAPSAVDFAETVGRALRDLGYIR